MQKSPEFRVHKSDRKKQTTEITQNQRYAVYKKRDFPESTSRLIKKLEEHLK